MWIKCTSCIIDQRRTKCDRHTWCQLSEKPMLWQDRTLLLVVTVTYKTYRGVYENFLFGEDGAHTQFSKTSQLASISLHNEPLPQNTICQTLVRVRSLGGHVKNTDLAYPEASISVVLWEPWEFTFLPSSLCYWCGWSRPHKLRNTTLEEGPVYPRHCHSWDIVKGEGRYSFQWWFYSLDFQLILDT